MFLSYMVEKNRGCEKTLSLDRFPLSAIEQIGNCRFELMTETLDNNSDVSMIRII